MPDDRPAATGRPDALPLLDRAEVGGRLRQVRKARQLTLKQLSALSGVPVSTLSKMELARNSWAMSTFSARAAAASFS